MTILRLCSLALLAALACGKGSKNDTTIPVAPQPIDDTVPTVNPPVVPPVVAPVDVPDDDPPPPPPEVRWAAIRMLGVTHSEEAPGHVILDVNRVVLACDPDAEVEGDEQEIEILDGVATMNLANLEQAFLLAKFIPPEEGACELIRFAVQLKPCAFYALGEDFGLLDASGIPIHFQFPPEYLDPDRLHAVIEVDLDRSIVPLYAGEPGWVPEALFLPHFQLVF